MRKLIQISLFIGLFALLGLSSRAWSPGGPIGNGGDNWQVPVIGYGLGGDLNAPKNIGEEYRRNVPFMYYAYDANFLGFYGLAGTTNVDMAFALMNGVLNGYGNTPLFAVSPTNAILGTNGLYNGISYSLSQTNSLDSYSSDLSEFSIEAVQNNLTATSLRLIDLKSAAFQLLIEQMGLTDPIRYAWTLHNRFQPSGTTCPDQTTYWVVQRNFEIFNTSLNQVQYTPYINDTLYTYFIFEICSGPNPLAQTVPVNVDPFASIYSPVAADSFSLGLEFGNFYYGLSRDDVAGLRYLMSTNNINTEATSVNGATLLTTNVLAPQTFGPTLPLSLLFSQSLTNDPATLQTNYPGLTYISVITNIVNAVTTNTIAYFTNLAGPYTNRVPLSNGIAVYPTNGIVPFTNWSPVQFANPPFALTTLPIGPLLTLAPFTDPVALQALYPGLLIDNVTTNYLGVLVQTNLSLYFTNLAGPYTNRVALSNGVAVYPTNGIVPFTNWSPVQFANPPFALTTLPLGPLLTTAPFTDPATLSSLYPGLVIGQVTTNYLGVQITTNISPYYTNQSVLPIFTNYVGGALTNGYYFTNQPGPTVINYDQRDFTQITTLNLADFIDRSGTNDAATLQALYPGLQILRSTKFATSGYVTNFVSYLTNRIGSPYPGQPTLVTVAVSTNSVILTNWVHTFGNVITNRFYTNRWVWQQDIWVTNVIGAPYPNVRTNITYSRFYTNRASGDFFIIPTNWCGFEIILTLPPNNPPYAYGITNVLNPNSLTNSVTNIYSFTRLTYNTYTNYTYAVRPGICQPVLAFATNYSTNVVFTYGYNFLNLVTNSIYTNSLVTTFTTNIQACPLGSPDLLCTNISQVTYYTNLPSGDFYIVPTNWCGFQILGLLTNLISSTNVVVATNSVGATNGSFYSTTTISYYTNRTFSIRPGQCQPALAVATNFTTNVVYQYRYSFANVVTNSFYTNNYITQVITNNAIWTNGLVGWITNIVVTNNYFSNGFWGDFYIVPTNWCGYQIIGLLTNTVVATNFLAATNGVGVPDVGQSYTLSTYIATTNYTFSIRPGQCQPALAFATNYSTNIISQYRYVFGNVVTNRFFTNGPITVVTTNFAIWTNGLVGIITNIVTTNILNTGVGGDFFIVPPQFCDFTILSTQLNTIVSTTNTFTATNAPGVIDFGQQYVQTTVSSYTNATFLVRPSTCANVPATPALRQGIGRATFIRANYDSLLGQFFAPITNFYTMVRITNSQPVTEFYRRVVTGPDFLMTAADLLAGPSSVPVNPYASRNLNFDQSTVLSGLAGPGVITPSTTITFNKSGRAILNVSPDFIWERTNSLTAFQWASYDISTNLPIVYPNGTDLQNLVNQLFIQVQPLLVPAGTVGVPYSQAFTVSGGQPPFVWAAPNISSTAPGLSFNASTATVSGTPTTAGVFSFTIQVTDSVNRTVNLSYTITIN